VYDLIVIGAGPGGYLSAELAATAGLKVLVIEKAKAGGCCLNVGCIPTKAMINIANMINNSKDLAECFDGADNRSINIDGLNTVLSGLTENMEKGILHLFKTNKIEYIQKEVVEIKGASVVVEGATYTSKFIIIATGSVNKPVTDFVDSGVDCSFIVDSTAMLNPKSIPNKLTVVGGGAIGVEFSYIYNAFGSGVSLLEYQPTLLPNMDSEAGKYVERVFKKKGIDVVTGSKLLRISKGENSRYKLVYSKKDNEFIIETDVILAAMGRIPNTDIKGIDSSGVQKDERGYIITNSDMSTDNHQVYAVGDVVSRSPMLAHTAYEEARVAVKSICNKINNVAAGNNSIDYNLTPFCIYSEPEVAVFGSSDTEKNKSVKVHFKSSGKANAIGKTDGFIKLLFDKNSGVIAGGVIVGYGATELIHQLITLAATGVTIEKAAEIQYAHPTISESFKELFQLAIK